MSGTEEEHNRKREEREPMVVMGCHSVEENQMNWLMSGSQSM